MTILDIVIEGKDEASGTFKSVDESLGKLGSTAGKAATIGLGLAAAGVTAVAGAAVAAGIAAINLSTDIDNATNTIAAKMGISKTEAEGFEDVMKGIFANNFGESFDDISQAVVTVSQSLGEMPDEALQGIAEDAFALRDAFDMDVTQSVTGAKALMEAFGISGEQSMDFIASGMQNGLNASDDFVESIGEYSNLFAESGFSADQMYNIMASGAQAGLLGTDKIADSIKEMGIKLNEGGDDTKAAFDKIGLSFDDISGFISSGDEAWADYFDDIVGGLNDIDDPMERSKAQVAIFGTMAEDLGVSFTEGLSAAGMSLEDMSMATEALNAQYENWPSMWEGAKRGALLALQPLGDTLLELGNKILPIVTEAFGKIVAWITENLPPAIEKVKQIITDLRKKWETDFAGIRNFVLGIWKAIQQEFDAFVKLFQGDFKGFALGIWDTWVTLWETVTEFLGKLWTMAKPHLETMWRNFVNWFNDQDWAQIGKDIVIAITDALTTFAQFIGPKLAEWFAAFVAWVGRVDWKGIATTIVTAVIAGLGWFVSQVGTQLAKWLKAFSDWAAKAVTWENIGKLVAKTVIAAMKADKLIKDKLAEWWKAFVDWFKSQPWDQHGDTVKTGIKEGLSNIWASIKETFEAMWTELVSWFTEPGKFEAMGHNIMDGLKAGIESRIEAVKKTITDFADGFNSIWQKEQESDSPSKVWWRYGQDLLQGLAEGIRDNIPMVIDEVTGLAVRVDLELVNRMADAITNVAKAIGPGFAAINAIMSFQLPATVPFVKRLYDFNRLVNEVVTMFARLGWMLTRDNLDMAASMAEAVIDVMGSVGKTIEAVAFLSDTDFDAILKDGYHLRDQTIILRNIVRSTMRMFAEAAVEIDGKLADSISSLARAGLAVFALIKPTIEAVAFLSNTDFGPILKEGYHLRDQTIILRNIVRSTMRMFAEAAIEMTTEGMSAISAYASAAGEVFGLVADTLDVIGAITDYIRPSNLRGKLIQFNIDMLAVTRLLVDTLGNLGIDMASLLAPAELAAASVNAIVGIIQPAIDGLAALGEYVKTKDVLAKVTIFAIDLGIVIRKLAQELTDLGRPGNMGVAVTAAADIAEKVQTIVGVIVPAVEALAALGEIGIVDISTKVTDLFAQVKVIIRKLHELFSTTPASQVTNAIAFSEAMAVTLGSVASAMASMNALLAEDTPEGLTGVLQQLQDILKAAVTPVYDIGLEIGTSLITGITDGITAGFETLNMVLGSLMSALGSPGLSATIGAGVPDGMGSGAGLTTNLNMGGLIFNTTINDQMTEDEFHFRVVESVRRMMTVPNG